MTGVLLDNPDPANVRVLEKWFGAQAVVREGKRIEMEIPLNQPQPPEQRRGQTVEPPIRITDADRLIVWSYENQGMTREDAIREWWRVRREHGQLHIRGQDPTAPNSLGRTRKRDKGP